MGLKQMLRRALSRPRKITAGEAAGLTLAAPHADPVFFEGTYEQPLQEAIVENLGEGDVFYDVGANIGFFSLIAARRAGPEGRVYAFEPVTANVKALQHTIRVNRLENVEVFAAAAGAETRRGRLLLADHIGGAVLEGAGTPPDFRGRIDVAVVALDDAMTRHGLRPPSVVKIDVEGAELDVLRGMITMIKTNSPKIIYEIDDETEEGIQTKEENIQGFLKDYYYEIGEIPLCYPNISWHVKHFLATPAENTQT